MYHIQPHTMARNSGLIVWSSVACLLLSLVLIIVNLETETDLEAEAVFRGDSGSLNVSGGHTVYISDEYECFAAAVTIANETEDFFKPGCDEIYDQPGWLVIGTFHPMRESLLSVNSTHEILIIDDASYITSAGYLGCGLCCLGLIGLVGGLITRSTSRKKVSTHQTENPYQSTQQPVQQQAYGRYAPVESQYKEDFMQQEQNSTEAEETSSPWD